ncbi:PucR family transcriptional regulator [Leucobacter insecticola]|uniref:PucR family transcriptional regulator n=1 Tax=Leucobacter insecticola TaxID=2714934 RepID=A0A6G8FL51_9MICO|nr:helix-turn-helix domain-containing protein [Leucobacter insecticola]QIM17081.1 PucR family transcriptional regulator [Leucobacter insecticola]
MSITLQTVIRAIGGECLPHRVTDRAQIDGVADIDTYVVIGNSEYVTLVTGTVDALSSRLGRSHLSGSPTDPLADGVFVTDQDSPEVRNLLAAHRMTAIVGTDLAGTALNATLRALVSDERAASERLVAAGMNVLTQVARRGGLTAVIAELAHRIDGWVVLLDPQGHLVASAGAGRLHITDAVAVALGRPVRVRHEGLQVHQVGTDQDLAGHLVIASRSSSRRRPRDLATQAAALVDLLLRTHDPSLTEHLGREALLNRLLAGGDEARTLLRRWGVHESQLTAFALGARTRTIDLERVLRRWLDDLGAEHVFASQPGLVSGFIRDDLVPELSAKVEAFAPIGGSWIALGLGTSTSVDALKLSAVQARQALNSALEEGHRLLNYARLTTVDLVLTKLAPAPREHLTAVLEPLRDSSGRHGDLTHTLRVFLAEHGAHRASAERLKIHRQTLRSRIQRIEELTGLSMEHADDRATAWLALRAAGF